MVNCIENDQNKSITCLREAGTGLLIAREKENCMFDLIDEISELLYISDPETYELLYLNKPGQEMFGVSDISGKKCYRVLQGKDAPCEFCTNGKLSQDKFYVWYHSNPIAHRHYLVKDKLISWQGKMARMEVAISIEEEC